MQNNYPCRQQKNFRGGFALLLLLIVIAIGIIVFYVNPSELLSQLKSDSGKELMPWKEWKILQSQKEQLPVSDEQPNITEILRYNVNANYQGAYRGEILLEIFPDGRIKGDWGGDYYNEQNVNFDIMDGGFEGKIWPSKIYEDANGQDVSKLYFITKGRFLIAESNFEKNTLYHRGGEIYVTGWIDVDCSIKGKITITSDKRYFEVFDFRAVPLR